ncbi:MAG: hypothetical protein GY859_31245 [Desulfobacterales bacterium]|nr:hypothetical protein [Desulfobacterales bacterium]
MDIILDNLFLIIVFIVMVVSYIRKKAATVGRDKQKGPEKKKSGFFGAVDKLKVLLEEAAEEQKAKMAPGGETGRKGRGFQPAELLREESGGMDGGMDAFAEDLGALPDFVDDVSPPKPPVRKAPVKKPPPARPAPAAAKSPLPDTGFAMNDLQKAIVWSEILGPPIALRKDRS